VFDLYGTDRLADWKKFRDSLETSPTPFEDVAIFWSRAPFVNLYLDPQNTSSWPDPWHLVMEGKYDDLAICLGMLYTIKLTQRFMSTQCEIHKSESDKNKDSKFFLVVDNKHILNMEYKRVLNVDSHLIKASIIWTKQ
jgi:hypothetical protein